MTEVKEVTRNAFNYVNCILTRIDKEIEIEGNYFLILRDKENVIFATYSYSELELNGDMVTIFNLIYDLSHAYSVEYANNIPQK